MTDSNKSSNLVTRLREALRTRTWVNLPEDIAEAASEIERLHAALVSLRSGIEANATDTVWVGPAETAVDYITHVLSGDSPPAPVEPTTCLGMVRDGVCSCGLGVKHAGSVPETSYDESAWLIEIAGERAEPLYWHAEPDMRCLGGFDPDMIKAMRFCREKDARAMALMLGAKGMIALTDVRRIKITEHEWVPSAVETSDSVVGVASTAAPKVEGTPLGGYTLAQGLHEKAPQLLAELVEWAAYWSKPQRGYDSDLDKGWQFAAQEVLQKINQYKGAQKASDSPPPVRSWDPTVI